MNKHCTLIMYRGWTALCVYTLYMCLYVCECGIEGKEEEWTVKFQRSACAREQSRDKGGLMVTNLQRKIKPTLFTESPEIKRCLQMQLLLFWYPVFPPSKLVKNLSSFTAYPSSLPFSRWYVGTKGTMALYHVPQSPFSGVVSWNCHELAQIARVRYLLVHPAGGWGAKCPVTNFSYIQQ